MSEEPTGNLVIYQTEDGRAQVECRLVDETIWLSQSLMGELFDRSKKTISERLQNLFEEGELVPDSVVRNFRTTAAAELIVDRANPDEPNMALTTWSGSRVRKHDVIVAKNYLSEYEVDTLNHLVVIFLEQAELRAKQKQDLTLDYWRQNVDRMPEFNEQPVLKGAGSVSRDQMKEIATCLGLSTRKSWSLATRLPHSKTSFEPSFTN